jgi:hypothetical protein
VAFQRLWRRALGRMAVARNLVGVAATRARFYRACQDQAKAIRSHKYRAAFRHCIPGLLTALELIHTRLRDEQRMLKDRRKQGSALELEAIAKVKNHQEELRYVAAFHNFSSSLRLLSKRQL